MNKNIVVDTSKINNETLKMISEFKETLDKAMIYLNKINEIKYPELTNDLVFVKKRLNSHIENCNCYTKHLNKAMKNFNDFTTTTIRKTVGIEKVNAHSLIIKK